jgi:hypothetical protein
VPTILPLFFQVAWIWSARLTWPHTISSSPPGDQPIALRLGSVLYWVSIWSRIDGSTTYSPGPGLSWSASATSICSTSSRLGVPPPDFDEPDEPPESWLAIALQPSDVASRNGRR